MSGGDVGTAVSLYLEHHSGSSSAVDGNHGGNSAGARIGGGVLNEDGDMMEDGDEVRAPDPTRRTRLMDFEGPSEGGIGPPGGIPSLNGMLRGGITEHMIRSINAADTEGDVGDMARHMGNPFGIGNEMPSSRFRDQINRAVENERDENAGNDDADVDADVDDDEVVDVDMEPRPPRRARRLGDMFEAPTHLMYNQGGFQGARTMAKDSKRWLLVNLQSDADFACHALNRDVWRNDLVENLVREGFIFWQSVSLGSLSYALLFHYGLHGGKSNVCSIYNTTHPLVLENWHLNFKHNTCLILVHPPKPPFHSKVQ